jgi:hypothetical protein
MRLGAGFIWIMIVTSDEGSYDHRDRPSDFIKGGEFDEYGNGFSNCLSSNETVTSLSGRIVDIISASVSPSHSLSFHKIANITAVNKTQ